MSRTTGPDFSAPPRSRWKNDDGQAVIEFALVLPLLAILIYAIFALGKAVYYYIELTHIANEGARIASVSPTQMPDGNTTESLTQYLCGQFGSGELRSGSTSVDAATVALSYGTATMGQGEPVTVSVSTTYHLIPYVGNMTITGSATSSIEDPPGTTGTTLLPPTAVTCS